MQRFQVGRRPQTPFTSSSQPLPCSSFNWLLEEADGPLSVGLHSPWGRGGCGAPKGKGELSVRGEWEGQEGTGGSEIWWGQASVGQDNLEPTVPGLWQALCLSGLEKGRFSQSLGRYPVTLWARHMCSETPLNTSHYKAMKKKCGSFPAGTFPQDQLARPPGSACPLSHLWPLDML